MQISKIDAIKILDAATDEDNDHWEHATEEYYDEETDECPTIFDVLIALGVTKEEYIEAAGHSNIFWPDEQN